MYYTYIMRCEDGSLYTGITTDVERRFKEHKGGLSGGAKYTKGHIPTKVEVVWQSENRSLASKLEYRIKKLSKQDKERLVLDPKLFEKIIQQHIEIELYKLV